MMHDCPQGWTPLIWAIEQNDLNMVTLLLARGADCINLDSMLVCTFHGTVPSNP